MRHSSDIGHDDLLVIDEEFRWDNEDNKAFYEALKAEGLQRFAEKGGLADGCDICVLTAYWANARSILDVGAGYGRAIDYLLKHQFQGSITAVERCNVLFEYLKRKFNQYRNVHLLHADIRFLSNINEQFDLILVLWSAFADFSPKEQPLVLAKLAKLLNHGGKLVIDTMPEDLTPLQAHKYSQQTYITKVNDAAIYTYEPTAHEMKQYAKKLGFFHIERITCQTDIGRERWLYILY